ncbi:MAG TPA: hypothetical protein VGP07_13805 [Polyangia bacterium]|jgi:hypothetical protein
MSVEIERATVPCGTCGARVTELRRGRCWGCYTRWGDSRPVGKGAACAVCNERRRSELRLMELHGRTHPFCHSCAGRIARIDTLPPSLAEIRLLLDRERRTVERRGSGTDRRIFPRERRVGERRIPPRATTGSDTDPHIVIADFEDIIIEIEASELEPVEQTMVRSVEARPEPT